MAYRYILRYYIDPGFQEEARIRELAAFCTAGGIAEVMFFYNAEELFQGYPDERELDGWFSLARRLKTALDGAGVAMSVNPWTTTVHNARGRRMPASREHFNRMTGETGVVSPITSCPLCPHWQRDISRFFARIAAEVAPVAIWVEDDFRLHNHGRSMGYGGCFCPLHLTRFGERIGRPDITREALLAELLAPAGDLGWRRAWLDVCRDSLLEPARAIRRAVHGANPAVRLGLMSSSPDTHSLEGRDWTALKAALSPEGPLLLRPNLPPYTEVFALEAYPAVTRQTVSEFAPGACEIYPELENSPRCGPYSKSAAFSAWECLVSPLYGATGITINHYDMMGNGIALDPDFGHALRAIRPRLDWLASLGAAESNAEGVDVLHAPDVAATTRPAAGATSYAALANRSVSWSRTLGILGVAHRLTTDYDGRRLTAVSGQTLRAIPEARLSGMLAGRLLLDAESALILVERGLGELAGLRRAEWRRQGDDGYAYEAIADRTLLGVDQPRMTAQRCAEQVLAAEPLPGAEVLSWICRYDRRPLYPGLVLFNNPLGGTVVVSVYPMETAQFYMGYFNAFRRAFLQDVLRRAMGAGQPGLYGLDVPLWVWRHALPDGATLLALANPTHDDRHQLRFAAPALPHAGAGRILLADGTLAPAPLRRTGEAEWTLDAPLPSLEMHVLHLAAPGGRPVNRS